MVATRELIDSYLTRLRHLAQNQDHIQRFYLFMNDAQLYDWEDELANSDQNQGFYDQLMEQYRQWKRAMTDEQWAEVLAYNDLLNSANQNFLLDELSTMNL